MWSSARVPQWTKVKALQGWYAQPRHEIKTFEMDHVVQMNASTSPRPKLRPPSPVSFTGLASILSNSKYIERYRGLNFEDHDLSCFDLTSKQLDLVAYIGRTSDNQRSRRIMEN